jgi:hypothetical protein
LLQNSHPTRKKKPKKNYKRNKNTVKKHKDFLPDPSKEQLENQIQQETGMSIFQFFDLKRNLHKYIIRDNVRAYHRIKKKLNGSGHIGK